MPLGRIGSAKALTDHLKRLPRVVRPEPEFVDPRVVPSALRQPRAVTPSVDHEQSRRALVAGAPTTGMRQRQRERAFEGAGCHGRPMMVAWCTAICRTVVVSSTKPLRGERARVRRVVGRDAQDRGVHSIAVRHDCALQTAGRTVELVVRRCPVGSGPMREGRQRQRGFESPARLHVVLAPRLLRLSQHFTLPKKVIDGPGMRRQAWCAWA
jgi:hypothetical protein